jgi:murein L,D-transpeptidase YafK
MRKFIIITSFIIVLASLFVLINLSYFKVIYHHIKYRSSRLSPFNADNFPNHNISLFDKELTDGFDMPLEVSLTSSSNIAADALFNPIAFHKFHLKKKLGCILSGEDYLNLPMNKAITVSTIAKGKVVFAENCGQNYENIVMILHKYHENGEIKFILSLYSHLKEIYVNKGDIVSRHQKIGIFLKDNYTKAMHFELRKESLFAYPVVFNPALYKKDIRWIKDNYESPSAFIKSHTSLIVPAAQQMLVLVRKNNYEMCIYNNGNKSKTYEVAISQEPGKKMNEGDNRTPEGEYRICQMFKGPFTEKDANGSGLFLGTRWLGLSYPNKYDALSAKIRGLVKLAQYDSIIYALNRNEMPPKNTYLGGGIGIHGWNGDWPSKLKDITWGCISMKQKDLEELYDISTIGTIVIITK